MDQKLLDSFRRIKLVLMDCDGVLTDGRINITDDGREFKSFDVKDGMGIAMLHEIGIKTGVISGRTSAALTKRAAELSMKYVLQGISDKKTVCENIILEENLLADEVCYIGDDINDLCLKEVVGIFIAVGDANEKVKSESRLICQKNGGYGAVREIAENIIAAKCNKHNG